MSLFLRGIPYFVGQNMGIRLFGAGLGLASVVGLEEFFVASAVLGINGLV